MCSKHLLGGNGPLGGNDALAAKVLAQLDLSGCVCTDTMGWYGGWLTPRGRAIAMTNYVA